MPEPATSTPVNPSPAQPVHTSSPPSDVRRADTIRSDAPTTPARALWQKDFDELTRQDDFRRNDIVIFKNPDGTLGTRPRDRSTSDAPPAAGDQPQTQQRPAGSATVDGGKLKIGELELSEADVRGLMERKGIEDSRKATMPKDAAGYELKLPENFEMPPGVGEFKWALEDSTSAAILGQAKAFAHSVGLDQASFSQMMGLFASYRLGEQAQFNAVQKQQLEMLGPNAAIRVDSVARWLDAAIGTKASESLRKSMFTASQVQAYESLMRAFVGQGVHGNVGAARDGGAEQPGKISDEAYNKLSFTDRIAYAQQFDQSKHR
jgi:hypothetical protein